MFTRLSLATLCLSALLLGSCTKDEPEIVIDPDGEMLPQNIASTEKVNYPVAYIGNLPSDLRAAFDIRFTNAGEQITGDTKIVILHDTNHDDATDTAIEELYDRGGIVVVLDPEHSSLSSWCEDNGFHYAGHSEEGEGLSELYAFNRYNSHYMMDYVPENMDHNEFLNSFVSWLNENAVPPVSEPEVGDQVSDITKMFDAQTITHTYNLHLKKEEAHVILSKPDIIEKWGQVDVKFVIYPLYAFEDQASHGDYYIVNASVTAHNNQMYGGKWVNWHGGVGTKLCGFYMCTMNMFTRIQKASGTDNDPVFAPMGHPVPPTTIKETQYTSGFSWGLSGTVTGSSQSSLAMTGSFSYNNSSTKVLSEVEIQNNWQGNETAFVYDFSSGAPSYIPRKQEISDPSHISTSTADFYQTWVWHVPTTRDYETRQFTLRNRLELEYGSCHFYSSKSDMVWHGWWDALDDNGHIYYRLTPPSRVPTGLLQVNNTMEGNYVTDIRIWKSSTPVDTAPDYVISESFSPGQELRKVLPTGEYRIQFKAGPNIDNLTSYKLNINTIRIKRAETLKLNSGFDFSEGSY